MSKVTISNEISKKLTLFGQEVVDLVIATTELPKSYPWQIRKENVIVRIKEKTQDEIAILLAEKIYNVRSIIVEEHQFGESIWQNFNASKEKQEWYYISIIEEVNLYHPDSLLLPQLQQAVDKLFVKVQK